jgi:hypothetical protein
MRRLVRISRRSTTSNDRPSRKGEGGHHAPHLARIVPGQIHAGDRDEHEHHRLRLLRLPDGDRDVQQHEDRQVDRRPLVFEHHFAAAVYQAVGRHEMRHVDGCCQPRLRTGADKHQIRAPAQQQRDHE